MIPSLILSQLCMKQLRLTDAKTLYDETASAEEVLKHVKKHINEDYAALERRAYEEVEWCQQHMVQIACISDAAYPDRLRRCADAPFVLFVGGKADLNAPHIVSIVGTRKCTAYGKDCVERLVTELRQLCPDIMIVSGLAYGIDIAAHRAALKDNIPTVGVVAHGQDTIYPSLHRNEANKMVLGNGGVLTEYLSGTRPEARNFLQRNRIIAGMSDATIVIESAVHGGGLVTARLAQDYGRDVMAIPGPIHSLASEGCNHLIRDNKAALITSGKDIITMMGWENAAALQEARQAGIERTMFVELSEEEKKILETLRTHGDQHANTLTMLTRLPINAVATATFTLEMKGLIKAMSGNIFHLIG